MPEIKPETEAAQEICDNNCYRCQYRNYDMCFGNEYCALPLPLWLKDEYNKIINIFRKNHENIKKKFWEWLISDDFYLHWGLLMIIADLSDTMATGQVLYNNKQAFLTIEQNGLLLWSLEHNMWWLFALLGSMLTLAAVALAKYGQAQNMKHWIAGRVILILIPVTTFIQPLYAILFLRQV